MQKLDKSHCKALLDLRSEKTAHVWWKAQVRTSIVLFDLWIMEVGHDRRRRGETRPEEVEGALRMVGRTTMKGIDTAPVLKRS
jgi:hypothetical protein